MTSFFKRVLSFNIRKISLLGNQFDRPPRLPADSLCSRENPPYLSQVQKLSHDDISRKRLRLEDVPNAKRLPLVVIADNIRSLYNVGSIFRTSDGAMIQQLILTGYTPTPPRKEIEKTALGSTDTVPWIYAQDPTDALRVFREQGFRIACLEQTTESVPYTTISPDHFPLCLVIGNEVSGVSKRVLSVCDLAIDIPMHGKKHSLNVAVAYGIALFELSRIWRSAPLH
jgi:23S rRNA (guanosine2251-2'-O)-methyltransferase